MADPDPEPEPELTPTGRVILGMIALDNRTGYEIKQLVDHSTRHFWAASYGQIYPELRRLERQGLIQGRPEPSGGRARTVYDLTPAGEAALADWLGSPAAPSYELRDEGMLRLFFSDLAPAHVQREQIHAMRMLHERKRAQLQELEPKPMLTGPRLTLELGLELTRCRIAWCERAERRLAEAEADPRPDKDPHPDNSPEV